MRILVFTLISISSISHLFAQDLIKSERLFHSNTNSVLYDYEFTYGKSGLIDTKKAIQSNTFTQYYYNSDSIIECSYNSSRISDTTCYYRLRDSSSFAGGNFKYPDTLTSETRDYDKNGYLIRHVFLDDYGTHGRKEERRYFYNDGNLIKSVVSKSSYSEGEKLNTYQTTTTKYIYDKNHVNTMSNFNHGIPFMGKSSTHLVISESITHITYGEKSSHNVTFEYEFDSKRRVVKKNQLNDSGKIVQTFTYQYFD